MSAIYYNNIYFRINYYSNLWLGEGCELYSQLPTDFHNISIVCIFIKHKKIAGFLTGIASSVGSYRTIYGTQCCADNHPVC